jgi:small-conductance mechanosensitive channel
MTVLEEDAAIEQVTRDTLAQAHRRRIEEAIENYRNDRRRAVLWIHALYAFGATLALVVVIYADRRTLTLARVRIERRYQADVQGIQDRAFRIVKADQIWRALTGLLNLAWSVVIFVAAYAYLHYVLKLFPWTRGLSMGLLATMMNPIRTMGTGLVGMIPDLAFLTILILGTRYVLKLMRAFFEEIARETVKLKGFEADWALPTYRLVRLLTIALAVVVAYPYVPGSGSNAFKGVSLFFGIVFSLGSSSLIGNLIAGYSLTYRRTFRPGDRVRIGEDIGDVETMRLLVTHIRTLKNEDLVVPNSTILATQVTNYSAMARERGLILHTTVGIGYETPWRQVEAMLLDAAARTQNLWREPSPYVLQKLLGDFCITYELNVYTDTPHAMEILYTNLHRNILDVFNEYSVQIMTPAYERDPEQPKIVPKEQWFAAPAQSPHPAAPSASQSGPSPQGRRSFTYPRP